MEFHFETAYDQKAVTAMAKALRKTVRKKRSIRSHIFGLIVVALALLLTLPIGDRPFVLDLRTIFTWLVALILILVMLFQDRINGFTARKRMLPGLSKATVTFREDAYLSETEIGKSEFGYGNITCLAETEAYFVFAFSQNHAQVYDKSSISGGTLEEFRTFIEGAVGKKIKKV